jgi:hypothetical protein
LAVCCVCKERGIGTNFHHIDNNPKNNDEDNIAVLCVQEHDQHHRPGQYDKTKHLELGADKIRQYKQEWEWTVNECKSDNPKVLAVVNAFGDSDIIHSVKFVVQNLDGKIIYERLYHWHLGTHDDWSDWIKDELLWLGKNVKLNQIHRPLAIDLCPCCKKSLSTTIDKCAATRITAPDWKEKSVGKIYINPNFPSLALIIFYGDEILYKAHLHKCEGRHLHLVCDNLEERTLIKKKLSIRTQATEILQEVVDAWEPGRFLIATGNPDNPTLINEFILPNIWEKKRKSL